MKGIKSAQYQNQIKHLFSLEVKEGKYKGVYTIKEPDGFDSINIIVDINEEYFNVDNFILGDSSKIRFIEYLDKATFDLIKGVFDEQGGDGQIVFRWQISNNGTMHDILNDNFQINLNKFVLGYEKSDRYIECEIKKREEQNKFFAREDTTINLFAKENIDGNPIEPVATQSIVFKESVGATSTNFFLSSDVNRYYTFGSEIKLFSANQEARIYGKDGTNWIDHTTQNYRIPAEADFPPFFPIFKRSGGILGRETDGVYFDMPTLSGVERRMGDGWSVPYYTVATYFYERNVGEMSKYKLIYTNNTLEEVVVEISNLEIKAQDKNGTPLPFSLYAYVFDTSTGNWTFYDTIAVSEVSADGKYHEISILNKKHHLSKPLPAGHELRLYFQFDTHRTSYKMTTHSLARNLNVILTKNNTGIKVYAETSSFSKKNKVVSLFNAIDKVVENYSNGEIRLKSDVLSDPQRWGNQVVATGYFLRGIDSLATRINTSFKSLFCDATQPLLALGYDIQGDKLVVEDLGYFFKDMEVYDLSDKPFVQENFKIENDQELAFNTLVFGTKKYSTKKRDDLKNFNTKMESATPIKSIKKKFEKQTDFIIDEYKINELIKDNSTSTNESDDDLVLIDTVYSEYFEDTAVFEALEHANINGRLTLIDVSNGWDSLPLEIGDRITILEGLNTGSWAIEEIKPTQLGLSKRANIQVGRSMTKISIIIENSYKNRNATAVEGFAKAEGVNNKQTCVNLIHNPKYQMFRWFPFFSGGLSKKDDDETINTTAYKNNGAVVVNPIVSLLPTNAVMPEEEKLEANISLERLRKHTKRRVFFNGEKIEISLMGVSFEEFYRVYASWRMERGYIRVRVRDEVIDLYPFGGSAFDYDRNIRELSIKGKIKSRHKI